MALPDTGASDGMLGLVLALGVAMLGAGVLIDPTSATVAAGWNE